MLIISNEKSEPVYIDSIDVPTYTEYFWGLNVQEMDYMLNPLTMFEELTTATLELEILGYVIIAPANWNLLIFSEETSQLDVVELSTLPRGGFKALVYDHTVDKIIAGKVNVVEWKPESLVRTPLFPKHIMLCHHLGPRYWACLSPSDIYNKFLKNKVIGDLMY